MLSAAAEKAEPLVLGSRGPSGIGGFLVGSVGSAVVAHAECPVVLVHDGERATDEHETDRTGIPSAVPRYRPVVLGLDVDHPDPSVIEFAFEEAVRRGTGLRVDTAGASPVLPRRPDHRAGEVRPGRPTARRHPFGARIGSATHAVLHHATAPVAVVAHG